MNPAPGSRPTIAIGIVTFRRPTLLGGLLDELAGRLPPAGADAFVVVVDNDPEGSAEAVAGARRAAFPVPLRYRREVLPGVSFARNAALAEADLADLVAFIDDDMRPAPGWLEALVAAQRATGAAAVTGPVEPA